MATSGLYTRRFFALLEALKSQTDESHVLSQTELTQLMDRLDFPMDRHSVKKALDEMKSAGYPIRYNHGWFSEHELSNAEIDFLIDGLRCTSYLSEE